MPQQSSAEIGHSKFLDAQVKTALHLFTVAKSGGPVGKEVLMAMSKRKKCLAVAIVGCLCAALVAVPVAYAFYYVHSDTVTTESDSNGVIEICCTVDATARGEGIRTGLVIIPENGTVADCLEEMVKSSESRSDFEAIHNYDYTSMTDYVADGTWVCTVFSVASQSPGTHTTQDGTGTEVTDLDSTTLQHYDNVVLVAQ